MGDTLRYPLLRTRQTPVQNPYARLRFGQMRLNGLQRAEALSGYPCLHRPVIVACRCHRTRGNGIGSSHISAELQDAVCQQARCRRQTLGLVRRQQRVQRVRDLRVGQSVRLQFDNFRMS